MAIMTIKKVVALGSAAILSSVALVASPAAAVTDGIKIELAAGTSNNVLHNNELEFKVSVTGGASSEVLFPNLKYYFETSDGVDVLADDFDAATGTAATTVVDASAGETKDVMDSSSWGTGDTVQHVAVLVKEGDGSEFEKTDDTATVTVTAFIDTNGDNVPNADDEYTASVTMKSLKQSEATQTLTLTTPVLNATSLVGTVSSANWNLAYTDVDMNFGETVSGTTTTQTIAFGSLTYTAVDDDLEGSSTTAVFANSTDVVAGAYYVEIVDGTTNADGVIGSRITKFVSATTVNAIDAAADATLTSASIANNATSVAVASGSGSLTYVATVVDSNSAGIEGKTVSLSLDEQAINSLDSAARVTAGGATLQNSNATTVQDVTGTAVTNADGEATFTISWSGLDDGDKFQFTAIVDGLAEAEVTATAADPTPTTMYNANAVGTANTYVVATDAAFTLTYHLVDQFGKLFTGTGYSVSANDNNGSGNNYTGAFVNGVATVSVAGYDEDADGAKTFDADMTAVDGTDVSGVTATQAVDTSVYVGSTDAAAAVIVSGSFGTAASPLSLNTKTFVATDVRFGNLAGAVENGLTATATVTDVNGNADYFDVTFSGTDLLFMEGSQVYASGSITLQTNASGQVDVTVYSNKSGAKTLTVTSGGVSSTKTIYFAAAAATAGTSLVISAPASVAAGSTGQVVATLTDKFGNPVRVTDSADILVTYSGPGIAFPSTLPTTTDANGQLKFAVLMGNNDSGTGTVTVSYDQSSDDDFTGAVTGDLDLNVTATFAVGATAVTQKVNAGSFKGYVAVYAKGYEGHRLSAKVGKDWVIVPSIPARINDLYRHVEFTGAGVDVAVRIYIDRVLIDTINLTTK